MMQALRYAEHVSHSFCQGSLIALRPTLPGLIELSVRVGFNFQSSELGKFLGSRKILMRVYMM